MPLLDRRRFLQLGLGSTISIAAQPSLFARTPKSGGRVRSVIWLWMNGGMCQQHTWDPKANQNEGCGVNPIDTAMPKIRVSELLPICAKQMANLSILRSVSHNLGEHGLARALLHGIEPSSPMNDGAPIGSILASELRNPGLPLPQYLSIGGPIVPECRLFGEDVCPVLVGDWPNPIPNVRRNVDALRDRERAALLLEQNKEWDSKRQQAEVARLEAATLKSEEIINTPLLKAFNISEEPADLRAAYGDGFGAHCLLARRLAQVGCPMIEVQLKGWERHHATLNGYPIVATLDRGLGTLIRDLAEKNLLDQTLVVCATAFGKRPGFGRDLHDSWSAGFSIVLAGGYIRGGVVIGDTSSEKALLATQISVKDVLATIYCAAGVNWEKEYRSEFNRKRKYALGGFPIEDLF